MSRSVKVCPVNDAACAEVPSPMRCKGCDFGHAYAGTVKLLGAKDVNDALAPLLDCVRPDAVEALQRKFWAENADLVKNAERYLKLREQYWASSDLFVVAGGKGRIKLGTDCPTRERLDALVDQLPRK